MRTISDKKIILGVTGGIAAYKSAEIIRLLKTAGAKVRVIMTPGAMEFIRPLTLQALSGNPVHHQLLDEKAELGMSHIELAKWGDFIIVAPASADFIASMAYGKADTLVGAVLLATNAKVTVCPAMNTSMWLHEATTFNVKQLTDRGVKIIGPDIGIQACGDNGPGRMSSPSEIANEIIECTQPREMAGQKVVITAGPTQEWLDPVRYISNQSSGKMGYAIAQAAEEVGADVTLISGPVSLIASPRINFHSVTSAEEMLEKACICSKDADIFISTAAVADYAPVKKISEKIKSTESEIVVSLKKNKDIAKTIANTYPNIFTVGFAAETENLKTYAKEKLKAKNLNAIIANDVSRNDIGFNSEDNEVIWIDRENEKSFPKMNKNLLAKQLITLIAAKAKNIVN